MWGNTGAGHLLCVCVWKSMKEKDTKQVGITESFAHTGGEICDLSSNSAESYQFYAIAEWPKNSHLLFTNHTFEGHSMSLK